MPPSPDGPRCSISGATSAITLRSLATVPALSATIVLTVGVGLGATVAALVLAKTVLVDPLPYADPGRLAWIYTDNPPYRFNFSVVDYRALEGDHPTFSAVAAYQSQQVTVADGDAAERVSAKTVTGIVLPAARPEAARSAVSSMPPTMPATIGSSS